MQQWPANRPRCHSDPVDSTSSLLSFGDYDGFERSASEPFWEDNPVSNRGNAGSCMYTALSQAMATVSASCQHQRLCENMSTSSSSPVSFVSSSITAASSAAQTASRGLKFASTDHTAGVTGVIPTSLADVFCTSDEQSESCDAASRCSPDSHYGTSPGLVADTTVMDNAGSPLRDPTTGLIRPKRRPYSKLQLMHLEQEFQQSMYPCRERRAWLSQLLSLSERQVKIWFQNRRTKLKRTVEKERKEHVQMQRDMATLAMQFYAPPGMQQ